MAQPNVAREPSMDEILASIRRIIESNDPVGPGDATSAEPLGFNAQPANDDGGRTLRPVASAPAHEEQEASHDDFSTTEAEVSRFPVQEERFETQPKSLSLADVAARVRAASERNSAMLRDPSSVVRTPVEPAPEPVRAEPEMQTRVEPHREPPVAAPEPILRPTPAAEPEAEMVQEETYSHTAPQTPVEDHPDEEAPRFDALSPLLSSSAGQQVARSFQELAFAVDDAHRRSFDEIAAELLRPLLQEWLDDNLPTLVERLVREEIERVARGPRR